MNFLKKLGELINGKKEAAVEKPVELKKRTKKLVAKKEMVDLGVTYVLLKFSDGRELIRKVYGNYSQNSYEGSDSYITGYIGIITLCSEVFEPTSGESQLTTSLERAETYLTRISKTESVYTDCPRVPTKSEVGKVITATILRTESNLEEVTKYSVEPV